MTSQNDGATVNQQAECVEWTHEFFTEQEHLQGRTVISDCGWSEHEWQKRLDEAQKEYQDFTFPDQDLSPTTIGRQDDDGHHARISLTPPPETSFPPHAADPMPSTPSASSSVLGPESTSSGTCFTSPTPSVVTPLTSISSSTTTTWATSSTSSSSDSSSSSSSRRDTTASYQSVAGENKISGPDKRRRTQEQDRSRSRGPSPTVQLLEWWRTRTPAVDHYEEEDEERPRPGKNARSRANGRVYHQGAARWSEKWRVTMLEGPPTGPVWGQEAVLAPDGYGGLVLL